MRDFPKEFKQFPVRAIRTNFSIILMHTVPNGTNQVSGGIMKAFRKTIVGVGMTAAATTALLAFTPIANAATDKQVLVWAHSYTHSVKFAVEVCSQSDCSSSAPCVPITPGKTASWVGPVLKVRPGSKLRGIAYNDSRCGGTPTQSSSVLTVPNDNSTTVWLSLG